MKSCEYQTSIDFLIFGTHEFPYKLPPNVRHHLLPYSKLIDRIQEDVLAGKDVGDLRSNSPNYYKAIDFKPLYAYLFPDQVKGYDWWGTVDNDMLMGDLRKWLTEEVLANNDVFSGIGYPKTSGPFTMYRNTPLVNGLFKHSGMPLAWTFANNIATCFDEWG